MAPTDKTRLASEACRAARLQEHKPPWTRSCNRQAMPRRSRSGVSRGDGGVAIPVFERGTGSDVLGDLQPAVDKIPRVGLGYTSLAKQRAN